MNKNLLINEISSDRSIKIEFNLTQLISDSVDIIRVQIDKLIELKGFENIIFDFKKISQIDMSGLNLILGRYNNILKKQAKLSIINVNNDVKQILELINLNRIIEIN